MGGFSWPGTTTGRGNVPARAGVPLGLSGCGLGPPCWALRGGLGLALRGTSAESRRGGGRFRHNRAVVGLHTGGTAPVFGCLQGKAVPASAAVNGNGGFQRAASDGGLP